MKQTEGEDERKKSDLLSLTSFSLTYNLDFYCKAV